MASPSHQQNTRQMLLMLIILIVMVTIWVWRAENISFSEGDAKEYLPPIELVAAEQPFTDNTQPFMHRNLNDNIINNNDQDITAKKNIEFGINTAPYDLSSLHIYGEEEYCNRHKYNIKYMDVTGMYDTGTNTFYMTLTKNCWGRETRAIDYITGYPPEGSGEEEKKQFRAKAQRLYDIERPKVLENVSLFRNVKWKPLTGKHHVISAEQDFEDPEWKERITDIRERLSLVIIKDPLTWFKSLCKASYEVHWQQTAYFRTNCPFGIAKNDGQYSANMWHSVKFRSVMDLWNWWYGTWTDSGQTISGNWKPTFSFWNESITDEYNNDWRRWMQDHFLDTGMKYLLHDVNRSRFDQERYYKAAKDIPHLVIRYEDILFQPERLINRLCKCVAGYVREGGVIIQESPGKGHGEARGRKQALQTYGNPGYRFSGYSEQDIMVMRKTLNKTLLELFSYEL